MEMLKAFLDLGRADVARDARRTLVVRRMVSNKKKYELPVPKIHLRAKINPLVCAERPNEIVRSRLGRKAVTARLCGANG
jgi:hypothetical protein